MKSSALAYAAIALLSLSATASATVVVSNLGNSEFNSESLTIARAISFTTGSGPGWTLDSVTASLIRSTGADDFVSARLYTDSGGLPDTDLNTFNSVTVSATGNNNATTYDFTPSATINLAQTTTYWFVLFNGAPSPDQTFFAYTTNVSETGATGWSIGDSIVQENSPGNWTVTPAGAVAYQIAVNATAVPEPSALALCGLGMLALFGRRRA